MLPVLAQWYESGLSEHWDKQYKNEAPLHTAHRVMSTGILNVEKIKIQNKIKAGADVMTMEMLWPAFTIFFWFLTATGMAVFVEVVCGNVESVKLFTKRRCRKRTRVIQIHHAPK